MKNINLKQTNLFLDRVVIIELQDMGFNISKLVRKFLKEKLEQMKNV